MPAVDTPSIVPPTFETFTLPERPVSAARADALGDAIDNPRDPDRSEAAEGSNQVETRNRFIPSRLANEILLNVFVRTQSFAPGVGMPERLYMALDGDGAISHQEAIITGSFVNGEQIVNNRSLYIPATEFNRFAVTREINDGLLAPRFAPSQRAYVASGFATYLSEPVPAS